MWVIHSSDWTLSDLTLELILNIYPRNSKFRQRPLTWTTCIQALCKKNMKNGYCSWRDDLVTQTLIIQAWGPQIESPILRKSNFPVIKDFWGSLPTLLVINKIQLPWRPVSKLWVGRVLEGNLPFYCQISTCIWTHMITHSHIQTHTCLVTCMHIHDHTHAYTHMTTYICTHD